MSGAVRCFGNANSTQHSGIVTLVGKYTQLYCGGKLLRRAINDVWRKSSLIEVHALRAKMSLCYSKALRLSVSYMVAY